MARLIDRDEIEIEVLGDEQRCATLVELAESDDGEPLVSILCRGDRPQEAQRPGKMPKIELEKRFREMRESGDFATVR